MSHASRNTQDSANRARIFAALGDETRLQLVIRLSGGRPRSISQLTEGSKLTRQAISKHLGVLRRAGMVRSTRAGRERRFELDPRPLAGLRDYLDQVSAQWDHTLARLKTFVEE